MSSDNRRTRTLLPRTVAPDNSPAASPTSDPSSSAGMPRSTHLPPLRTHNRSACLACRKRRSRCSGGTPCSKCRSQETECIYNELDDKRRREAKIAGSRECTLYKKIHHGLSRALREDRGQDIINLIRDQAALEVIALMIDNMYPETIDESLLSPNEGQTLLSLQRLVQQREGGGEPSGSTNVALTPTPRYPGSEVQDMGHNPTEAETTASKQPVSSDTDIGEMTYIQPLVQPPTEMEFDLGKYYLHFRDSARILIERGVPRTKILGDSSVSCSWLLLSDRLDRHLPFGVTGWATTVVNSVANVDILFRLAWLCYLIRFIRCAVDPSEEHYRFLPQAMRFTRLQGDSNYDPAIDLIPIPQIRDAMIGRFRDFPSAIAQSGASIYWTEPFDDAFEEDSITGNKTISAKFEGHIANAENFCFGRSLLVPFPDLEGLPQIAEVDHIIARQTGPSPDPSIIDFEATP